VYPLDVFHAERHTSQSNFRIETSIDCLVVEVD
jgi:fibro-slime domain-containing protein